MIPIGARYLETVGPRAPLLTGGSLLQVAGLQRYQRGKRVRTSNDCAATYREALRCGCKITPSTPRGPAGSRQRGTGNTGLLCYNEKRTRSIRTLIRGNESEAPWGHKSCDADASQRDKHLGLIWQLFGTDTNRSPFIV